MVTEKLESLLAAWRAVEPQQVALGKLKEDPMFQPRNLRLIPFADRGRQETASKNHIDDLASKLSDGRELEPLLAARIDGKLWLVDGHHRLKAYRRQQRRTAPVRIMDTDQTTALLVSKAVNCDGVKLPMHTRQKAESAWQYLALVTDHGRLPLPEGSSERSISRTFGVSRATLGRMRKRLPTIKPAEYGPEACDAGTGWPQWKHCCGNAWKGISDDMPEDVREQRLIERTATRLAAIKDKVGAEVLLKALKALQDEAIAEAADKLAEAEATEDAADY